jgi:hypothetical protein
MKLNPLSWLGLIASNIVVLVILVVLVCAGYYCYTNPNLVQKLMNYLPEQVRLLGKNNVGSVHFDSEKVKDFYDAILTNETLENLNGSIPKITNITCEEDDCNIEFTYDTMNGTVNENVTLLGSGYVVNFTSDYITPDPERVVHMGQGNAFETDELLDSSVDSSTQTLSVYVETEVNCKFKVSKNLYSLYPNGNVYIIIYGTHSSPSDCVATRVYEVTIDLPEDYKVNEIYVTLPYNKKI